MAQVVDKSPIKILLVEDNPDDAELIQLAFTRANFANPVRVARNGQQALDHLAIGGALYGRVRAMKNFLGQLVEAAPPEV